MKRVMICSMVMAGLGAGSTGFGATALLQPDQRKWLLPTLTTDQADSVGITWGSTELVVNGGFEDDTWAVQAGVTVGRSSTISHSGTYSLTTSGGSANAYQQAVVSEPNAIYKFSAWAGESTGNSSRILVNVNGAVQHVITIDNNIVDDGFVNYTADVTLPSDAPASVRINLHQQSGTPLAYWDDISLRPENLYVYRSDSPFTNTGDATLIDTLNGLTATGYTDTGLAAGDYWYAISATSTPMDVTSFVGTVVPEPASLGLLLSGGLMLLRRGRRVSA